MDHSTVVIMANICSGCYQNFNQSKNLIFFEHMFPWGKLLVKPIGDEFDMAHYSNWFLSKRIIKRFAIGTQYTSEDL